MQTSNEILDAIAARLGTADAPCTDYRIAQALDVPQTRISSIRHGRIYLSKALAVRAAALLGLVLALALVVLAFFAPYFLWRIERNTARTARAVERLADEAVSRLRD